MPVTPVAVMARARLAIVALAFAGSLSTGAGLRAQAPPAPPGGEVRLESGRVVQYVLHFDRNSLRDSLRVGDRLIAVTSSETLLRFELPAVRLAKERIDVGAVRCLGRGEGDVPLAGLADGRVCRIDPVTLDLATVATLPAAVQWIGWSPARGARPAGLVVVTQQTKTVEQHGRRWDVHSSAVHDLATGKEFKLDDGATTVLLDTAGRLWLGADRGEWGGHVARINLAAGTLTTIKPPGAHEPTRQVEWLGVYGFVELRDGQVWAHGGTSHMSLNMAFITRVDGADSRPLYEQTHPQDAEQARSLRGPLVPITQIVEDDAGLLVLAFSDVFRVDKDLKSWTKAAELKIHYRWGRPDAVGSYPSVRAIHPPRHPGEPYVLATVGDGYVFLDGAKSTTHKLRGQLAAPSIKAIANTNEGPVVFPYDDRLPVWRLGANGWEIAELAPPIEPEPDNKLADYEKSQGSWYATRVMVGPGGTIYTASAVAISPGTRTIARRSHGKPEQIGRETSSINVSATFITADGTLWNAFFGELKRLEKGRWELVARLSGDHAPDELQCLNTDGPPWVLIDRRSRKLWRLELGARGASPRLKPLDIWGSKQALPINDGLEWSQGALLLATDEGLRAYAPATRTLVRAELPEPKEPATALARDGLGRLWLGTDTGLWLGDVGAKSIEGLQSVPWVGTSKIRALAADPEHADGVIVALGERGVAFMRAGKRP